MFVISHTHNLWNIYKNRENISSKNSKINSRESFDPFSLDTATKHLVPFRSCFSTHTDLLCYCIVTVLECIHSFGCFTVVVCMPDGSMDNNCCCCCRCTVLWYTCDDNNNNDGVKFARAHVLTLMHTHRHHTTKSAKEWTNEWFLCIKCTFYAYFLQLFFCNSF